jgi:hypothetical protein
LHRDIGSGVRESGVVEITVFGFISMILVLEFIYVGLKYYCSQIKEGI